MALSLSNPFSTFFFLACCFLLLISCHAGLEKCRAEIRGMFVFGSSLVDNGNNNYIRNSTARADYLPYGIDFRFGPSGRFSNGRNPIDVLGQLLKLPHFVPAFEHPKTKGKRILWGVNFASGGSGILDTTGSVSGGVISLNHQIRNFEMVTLPELHRELGGNGRRLKSHLSKSLFVFGTGGNDYLLNYFLPTGLNYHMSIQNFTTTLITDLSHQLKRLYKLGGRKFVVLSVQVMGCIPVVVRANGGACVEPLNQAALLFNTNLKSLVHSITPHMPGSNLVYVNSYKIIKDLIHNPNSKGFKETKKACCETSGNGILCARDGRTCEERNAHVYFDGLHPTDAVNAWIAKKAYTSNCREEVYPINVKQLATL